MTTALTTFFIGKTLSFSLANVWKSENARLSEYVGCGKTTNQRKSSNTEVIRCTVWGRALPCKRQICFKSFLRHLSFIVCRSRNIVSKYEFWVIALHAPFFFSMGSNLSKSGPYQSQMKASVIAPANSTILSICRFLFCLSQHGWFFQLACVKMYPAFITRHNLI